MPEATRIARLLGLNYSLKLIRARRTGGEELIRGFFGTPAVIALLDVGLFDELEQNGRVSVESFAAQRHLDPEVLESLCTYLYAMKYLNRSDSAYVLSPSGRLLAQVLQGPFYMAAAYAPVFQNLNALLRGEKRYGRDVCKDIALSAKGSGAVGNVFTFPLVIDLIGKRGFRRVADLGCGDASFLIALCQTTGGTGVGVDLSPEALADADRNIREAGLQASIELICEDMFKVPDMAEQLAGIEAATIFFVLHEFLRDRERVVGFLRAFKESFPRTSLIVTDSIRHDRDELRRRPGPLMDFQLTHELTGQKTLSREQWRALFRDGGFASVDEDYLRSVRMAVYTAS